MTPTEIDNLIARLEAAEGPDRELDLLVLRLATGLEWEWYDREAQTVTLNKHGHGAVGNPICSLEPYTTSMDAAIAFTEAKLPGWAITMAYWQDEGWCSSNVMPCGPDSYGVADPRTGRSGHIFTGLAIAILIATLKAMKTSVERNAQ